MPGKRKHKYTRALFEIVDIETDKPFRIAPSGIHPIRSIYSFATVALLLNGGVNLFFGHDVSVLVSALGAVILYVIMKQVGVYVFSQEGIFWRHWGLIPIKVIWEEVDKVRKVQVFSPFSRREVNALRIVTESDHWALNSTAILEQSILLPEDIYDLKELTHAEIYANHYLTKIKQTAPSKAQLLKIRGTHLWENRNKAFRNRFLVGSFLIFIFVNGLFLGFFEARFVGSLLSNLGSMEGWSAGLVSSAVVSAVIGLWIAKRDHFSSFVLFAGNEYGSIIFDPNDEITRFRIMVYCLPLETKLLAIAPLNKVEDLPIQPTSVKEPGKLKAVHPSVVPPGEVTHIIAEIFGDAQNTISLQIDYEIGGKKQEQVLWLVGERELTGASLDSS